MSPQADYVVSNGTGAAVRSDINGQLAAIVSNNSGASAPATTYAYMLWADTSTNLLKLRNGANSAWITIGDLTAANLGLATLASPTFTGTATIPTLTVSTAANIPLGSAASPTLYFTGDSNTGLYSPGADQVALSTGGTGRLFIDSSGRCGIGTSSPSGLLQLGNGAGNPDIILDKSETGAGTLKFYKGGSASAYIQYDAGEDLVYYSPSGAGGQVFYTSGNARLTINSAGNVGIGSNAPQGLLDLGAADSATALAVAGWRAASYNGSILQWGGITASQWSTAAFFTAGSERARIDSAGRWLLGTSTSRTNFFNTATFGSQLLIEQAGSTAGSFIQSAFVRNSADTEAAHLVLGKTRGTTVGSNTVVQSGDQLGVISFEGADGSELVDAASIQCVVDGTPGANDMPGRLVFSTTADGASSPSERLRITNAGDVLLGKTVTTLGTGVQFTNLSSGNVYAEIGKYGASVNGDTFLFLTRGGTTIGTITQNGTTQVAYNTTSDYRLKENIGVVTDGIVRLQQLKPYRFNFIAEPERTVDGFIAHEVQDVVPEAVTGEKDAEDAEGNPIYQGIDQSKLVPLLTAALQEAIAKIETLEARITALESA